MHMQGRDGVLETLATTCVVSETMKPQTLSEQREPMSQNGLVFFGDDGVYVTNRCFSAG